VFVEKREQVWSDVASAAETGWDFSTRWFAHNGTDAGNMRSIRTWNIVPVDLNAFMCSNSRMMASMYELTGAHYFIHSITVTYIHRQSV
jgi:alpha,alpha-trehalase